MFKAVIDASAENPHIIIGLSHANIRELRKDNPIVFCLSELMLKPYTVCITYQREGGAAAIPKGFSGATIAFTDDSLDDLLKGAYARLTGEVTFTVFAGRDEASIENMLRDAGLIGPQTKQMKREGFSPVDTFRPSEN